MYVIIKSKMVTDFIFYLLCSFCSVSSVGTNACSRDKGYSPNPKQYSMLGSRDTFCEPLAEKCAKVVRGVICLFLNYIQVLINKH